MAALKATDALHNASATDADLRAVGPEIWQRFKRGPKPTLAYGRKMAAAVRSCVGPHPQASELDNAIAALEQANATAGANQGAVPPVDSGA